MARTSTIATDSGTRNDARDSSSARDTGRDSDTGNDTGYDRGTAEREETQRLESVSPSDEVSDNPAIAVIEAIADSDVPQRKRRGRPAKLNTTDAPARTQGKQAEFYINLLAELCQDVHALPAALVDERLAWSKEECRKFGELSYEVVRNHNWLHMLDKATDARFVMFFISVEFMHVSRVSGDKSRVQQTAQAPMKPPVLQSGGRAMQANGGGVETKPVDMPANPLVTAQMLNGFASGGGAERKPVNANGNKVISLDALLKEGMTQGGDEIQSINGYPIDR